MKNDKDPCSGRTSLREEQQKYMRNRRPKDGFPTRYLINTWTLFDGEKLKRVAFGEKDESKPHKTILLVGESGKGKSTLINAIVNYMLGVESKDRIWFEIIETKENRTKSQTKAVTVYDVFTEHSLISLTVINTPGFGSTEGREEDLKVAEGLHELFVSNDWVHEIDAVCLVVSSSTVLLTESQRYIFNAICSLFASDIKQNFVVFITHAPTKSTNTVQVIKDAKIPCAQTADGKPVHFRFDNCHCENFYVKNNLEDEKEQLFQDYQAAWELFNTSFQNFLAFLKWKKPVSVKKTESVLTHRKHLGEHITRLTEHVGMVKLQKIKLDQENEALRHHKERMNTINFEYEVEESYKEKVPIDQLSGSSKEATCCRKCEENCHYPGCWWVRDLSWCGVMVNNKCTVCPGKCSYTDHVKEAKIYVKKTRKVKKTLEDLKRSYERESEEKQRRIDELVKQITKQGKEITNLVEECHKCLDFLQKIALRSDVLKTPQDLDVLIHEAKETQCTEIIEKLKELKKQVEEEEESKTDKH